MEIDVADLPFAFVFSPSLFYVSATLPRLNRLLAGLSWLNRIL